ncbi:PAS domain S-box-containing protein/diguanylate cyclase (GGDEF) domain-containing protein [Actinopolymorpha singaporensis]|uniref:PAS domain S-box-containing protein/diguanylate cyclase (GGDEF) domain-containing protein n=1 Tax=Actinopolymorpha singaporensis TaxID=117157 RepID=A0A1H1S8N5_9ACTN|nr:PAS domain S-box-containing protein/diguanylate cyclase (GGDEF) domain-containing protein [Actinopolymorpha singaporensis]
MDEEHGLRQRLDAFRMLHRVSRELSSARDLSATLQFLVDSVVSSLGFGVAAINVVHGDSLRVAAVAGPPDVRAALEGQSGPRDAWEDLLASAVPWGTLRFVPHGVEVPSEVPVWVSDEGGAAETPGAWHPEDALVAPLYAPDGELVGVLSVDLPLDGRVPGELQRELLEMFAAQAAVAVDNARLHSEVLSTMERLEQEHRALQASEESFRQVFESAPSGMAVVSLAAADEGELRRVNAALCHMLDYSDQELRRRGLAEVTHPKDRHLWSNARRTYRGDLRMVRRDGRVVWVSTNCSVVVDATGVPDFKLVHLEDVSERHDREEQLAHLAAHDPLTGLSNRVELRSRLHQLVAERRDVCVLFCDIDRFKHINDQYGHEVGDVVLVEVARRLRALVRKHDVVARIGGDEFVLALRDTTEEEATVLARRLAADVRRPVRFGQREVQVAVSIGLGASTAGADSVDELLRTADQAMYRVKLLHTYGGVDAPGTDSIQAVDGDAPDGDAPDGDGPAGHEGAAVHEGASARDGSVAHEPGSVVVGEHDTSLVQAPAAPAALAETAVPADQQVPAAGKVVALGGPMHRGGAGSPQTVAPAAGPAVDSMDDLRPRPSAGASLRQ